MATNSTLNIVVDATDNATPKMKSLESGIIRTVGAITAAFASIKAVLFPIEEASDFEKEMKNVQKTTNFADEEIKLLSGSLLEMSRVLGVAEIDLAKIAAIAGQLGLGDQGRQAIEAFTKSVARASVTLDLTAEEAANAGAQIASIFKLDLSQTERVFATINELSNNSVATASDLIDIIKRVGSTSNATFTEVAALAAVMREVGVPNEQAGTALVKFLSGTAAEAKKFAKVMGTSTKQWLQEVDRSAVTAFKSLLAKIAQLPVGIQEATTKELLGSGRLFSAATKLTDDAAKGFTIATKMANIANEAFVQGTSSIREYETIMDSLNKSTDVVVDSFKALMVEAGNESLPVLTQAMKDLASTLSDPKVIAFAVDLGKGLADIISGVIATVKEIKNWDVEWRNVIAVIKLFLAYKVAQTILGIGISALNTVGKLGLLYDAFSKLVAILQSFATASAAAGFASGAGAAATAGKSIGPALKNTADLAAKLKFEFAALAASGGGLIGLLKRLAGASVAALASPQGVAIALIATVAAAAISYRKEIMDYFGFVDGETEKLRRSQEERRRAAQKELDDAKSKFDTAVKEAKKTANADGSINIQSNASLASQSLATDGLKGYREELQNVAKALDVTKQGVDSLALVQERGNKEILKNVQSYSDITKKIQEARKEIERLEKAPLDGGLGNIIQGAFTNFNPADQIANIVDSVANGVLTEAGRNEEIAKQRDLIKELTVQQDFYSTAVEQTRVALKGNEQDAKALTARYVELQTALSGFNDPTTVSFVKIQSELKTLGDQISNTEGALKSATKAQQAFIDSGRPATEQPATTARIPELLATIQKMEEKRQQLTKESDTIEKSFVDKKLAESIKMMDTSQVTRLAESFAQVSKEGNKTNTVIEQMKLNLPDALIGYNRTKKLAEALKQGAAAAEDFRKTAESTFNNTKTEIASIIDGIKNFNARVKESFKDIKLRIQVTNADKEIDRQLKKAEELINKFYDRQLTAAGNAEKAKLERSRRMDEDFFNGELPPELAARYDAEIAKIDEVTEKKRQAALAQAAADAANSKTANEATAAQIQYQRALQSVATLMEQAKQAAAQGKISDALTIKEQAKKSLTSAMDLVEKLQNLTVTDASGNIGIAIDESTIQQMQDEITQAGSEIGKNIQQTNEDLFKKAQDAATEWNNANNALQTQLASQTKILDEYRAVFRNFDSVLKASEKAFDGAIQSSTNAASIITRDLSNAKDAISVVNGDRLVQELTKAKDKAVEIVGSGVKPDAAVEALDASLKRVGPQLKDSMSALLENANLAISDSMSQNLTVLAEQQAKKLAEAAQRTPIDMSGSFNAEQIQEAIKKLPTPTIDIKGNIIAATGGADGAQKNARGGFIRGPGTATSDSILSWLSNGEYVIDAFTTGFFGSAFFQNLQTVARSGRSIPKMKKGLPGFAAGGPVNITQVASQASGLVPANININGFGSFPGMYEPDVLSDLGKAAYKAALKQGRRRSK